MKSRELVVGASMMRALATLVVVDSLLLGPRWIASGGLGPNLVALEALVVVGAFLALPRSRWTRVAAWITAGLLVVVGVLLLGDATARMSLARPLNLYLDLRLLGAVSNLLSGSLGPVLGVAVLAGGVAASVAIFVGLSLLLEGLPNADPSRRRRWAGVALVAVGLVLIPLRWVHPRGVIFGLSSVDLMVEQTRQTARMLGERDRFAGELASSPSRYSDVPGLLTGLGGRDVVMAFVESYGMTVLEDPRYAPVVRPRLQRMQDAVVEAGLHMVTGSLVAPSQGGQS
ncbi:MAG: hypothetical protein R3253_10750, partial [Longimicrobiales bacterium]|nr:hypothetical protein [Longimicrobiales bacterium]